MKKIEHDMFEGVSDYVCKKIFNKLVIKKYKKGEVVHFNTDVCKNVDFLLNGSIEVEHLNEAGDRLIVRIFKKNDVVGINVAFSSMPYYIMNFIAREDLDLLSIDKEVILEAMSKDRVFMTNVLRNLSDNSLTIGSRIKDKFKVTIRNQLMTYLDSLQEKQLCNPVKIPISKTELAEHFGVSRTSISRELNKMEKDNLIIVNGKEIKILKS